MQKSWDTKFCDKKRFLSTQQDRLYSRDLICRRELLSCHIFLALSFIWCNILIGQLSHWCKTHWTSNLILCVKDKDFTLGVKHCPKQSFSRLLWYFLHLRKMVTNMSLHAWMQLLLLHLWLYIIYYCILFITITKIFRCPSTACLATMEGLTKSLRQSCTQGDFDFKKYTSCTQGDFNINKYTICTQGHLKSTQVLQKVIFNANIRVE